MNIDNAHLEDVFRVILWNAELTESIVEFEFAFEVFYLDELNNHAFCVQSHGVAGSRSYLKSSRAEYNYIEECRMYTRTMTPSDESDRSRTGCNTD